jgi:hypothetical protein
MVRKDIHVSSGRHLGHYKCHFDNDQFQYTDNDPDPNDKIMQVYHQIASSAVKWGVRLHRWQHSITSMIEKVPGCPKINRSASSTFTRLIIISFLKYYGQDSSCGTHMIMIVSMKAKRVQVLFQSA